MKNNIQVTRSFLPEKKEYMEELSEIWESHWITNMGVKHLKFQEKLEEYMGVKHVELLTNGHMALELTLQALKLQGEVITTPFTFASTTHAIVRNKLEPVFCDINQEDFTIDVTKLESLITGKTSAILPVHVYGNICNVEEIERIARKYNLKVIYDAAHSFGVTYRGKGIGLYGDASCFSFHATKVFHTVEGGAVCYEDTEFGQELCSLKNFGIHDVEYVSGIGANAKMNEFCAAMGLCNLRHINQEISNRKMIDERYRTFLEGVKGIGLRRVQKEVQSNYAYFPVVIDETALGVTRNEIHDKLLKQGIGTRKYFYPITNAFECYSGKYNPALTPVALSVSERVLALPIYGELDIAIVDEICNTILNLIR